MTVVVVVLVDLVDQSEVLEVHVGRCRQPKGHQQQRHDLPDNAHARALRSKPPHFKILWHVAITLQPEAPQRAGVKPTVGFNS